MIFYFSGTGNSRWAARQLAARTGDKACDIAALRQPPDLRGESRVGLVFPVYAWGPPQVVAAFAGKLARTGAFTFGVGTCGAEAGLALKNLSRVYPLDSCYSLVMPSNYIVAEDLESDDVICQKLAAAAREIEQMAGEILARRKVYRVKEGPMARFKSGMVNAGFNRFARSTKPFHADDRCTGCGQCARDCPAGTITLTDGRPVWGKTCYQCLRCLHECPQQAIQYGKGTRHRGRYTIQNYLDKL